MATTPIALDPSEIEEEKPQGSASTEHPVELSADEVEEENPVYAGPGIDALARPGKAQAQGFAPTPPTERMGPLENFETPEEAQANQPARMAERNRQSAGSISRPKMFPNGRMPLVPAGLPIPLPESLTPSVPIPDALNETAGVAKAKLEMTPSGAGATLGEAGRRFSDEQLLPLGKNIRADVNRFDPEYGNRFKPTPAEKLQEILEGGAIGGGELAGGLSTPENIALAAGMGGAPEGSVIRKVADAAFAKQLIESVPPQAIETVKEAARGNLGPAAEHAVATIGSAVMGYGAARGIGGAHPEAVESLADSGRAPAVQPSPEPGTTRANQAVPAKAAAVAAGSQKPIALQPEEVTSATAAGEEPGGVRSQREGGDVGGKTAEAGVSDSVQPAAQGQAGKEAGAGTGAVIKSRLQNTTDSARVRSGEIAATEVSKRMAVTPKGTKYVEVGGRKFVYNPAKTSEQAIREHVAKGELYKLTGEKPPEQKVEEAKQATRPESEGLPAKPVDNVQKPEAAAQKDVGTLAEKGVAGSGQEPSPSVESAVNEQQQTPRREGGGAAEAPPEPARREHPVSGESQATPAAAQEAEPQRERVASNRDKFLETYTKHLKAAVEDRPDDYGYPPEKAGEVAGKMVDGLAKGSANKDSAAVRKTLKELGIKDNYGEIKKYLAEEAKPEAKPQTKLSESAELREASDQTLEQRIKQLDAAIAAGHDSFGGTKKILDKKRAEVVAEQARRKAPEAEVSKEPFALEHGPEDAGTQAIMDRVRREHGDLLDRNIEAAERTVRLRDEKAWRDMGSLEDLVTGEHGEAVGADKVWANSTDAGELSKALHAAVERVHGAEKDGEIYERDKRMLAAFDGKVEKSEEKATPFASSEAHNQAFARLADAQRGLPEAAMLKVQHHPLAAGLHAYTVEHIGDLTHRMSEQAERGYYGYDSVKDKVEKVLRRLKQDYGYEREVTKNRHNNFSVVSEKGTDKSFGDLLVELKNLGKDYSAAHADLPVFNRVQEAARDAAVAMGHEDYRKATEKLEFLKSVLDRGQEAWDAEASRFEPETQELALHPEEVEHHAAGNDTELAGKYATEQGLQITGKPMELRGENLYPVVDPALNPHDPAWVKGSEFTPGALKDKIREKVEKTGISLDAIKEREAKKIAVTEPSNASTIETEKEAEGGHQSERGTAGEAADLPGVSQHPGEGGAAPGTVPSEGERATAGGGDVSQDAGRAGGEVLQRSEDVAEERGEPARSGGSSEPSDTAAGRKRGKRAAARQHEPIGADGKPVDAPPSEPVEKAKRTAAEIRNQRNLRIPNESGIGEGGEIGKIKGNLDALETLKKIEKEGREVATPEEQKILAQYVDFGGLAGLFDRRWEREYAGHWKRLNEILTPDEVQAIRETIINTHHTALPVVDWMWTALDKMGFRGGRVLEPSMGIGNFFGRIPDKINKRSELFGVELNPLTGKMAQLLYPDAKIQVKPFQKFLVPDNSLDVAIGNVPFADVNVTDDPLYKEPKMSLHNYFIVKALDKVRPGGIAALITSRYTLDNSTVKGQKARAEMAKRADLVASFRLPSDAFKGHARTEVVTDLLIFRKRDASAPAGGEAFQNLYEHQGESKADSYGYKKPGSANVNEYYQKNPENVLGEHAFSGSMYGPAEYTVVTPEGQKFLDNLTQAMDRVPQKAYGRTETASEQTAPATEQPLSFAPENVKPGAFFKDEAGKVHVNEKGATGGLPEELKAHSKHIGDAIDLRDKMNELLSQQLASSDDAKLAPVQKELGKLYDSYVKKYGAVNGPKTAKVFRSDPEYPKLLALENLDPETKEIAKADLFSKRVISPYEPLRDLPSDSKSAMLKVMADQGNFDIRRMAELLKKPVEEVAKDLEGKDLVYRDPVRGVHITTDEYLSGDVRSKLKQAEAAAEVDPQFQRNADALKKVQPEPLSIHEILPKLGMTWIPTDVYSDFLRHLAQQKYARDITIARDPMGEWKVDTGRDLNGYHLQQTWAGGGLSGDKLLEYALNQRPVTIRKRIDENTTIIDQEATMAAREKTREMQEEFQKWMRAENPHTERIEQLYNDTFNGRRLREFSGAHLDFPGMASDWVGKIKDRGYQTAAVWRNVQDGRALLGHDVGLGKTLTMVASGMEMKRVGLSRKNLYAVPNHMVEQWREDFKKFYPGANVLMVSDKDFDSKNRQKLMSRIAANDWDAVIVAHSQFDLLPVSPAREAATIQKELDRAREVMEELKAAEQKRGGKKSRSLSTKNIEKSIDKMESKLLELNNKKKDNAIYFDQLGIDHMFVDEAHAYKALPIFTRMGSIAGLSTRSSQRALGLKMKTDLMFDTHKGRGVTLATGTDITNTLGEVYTFQRYLAPDMLETAGIRSFDDWAANFATQVTNWEYAPDGVTFRPKAALAEFTNVPELATMVRSYADYQTKEQARLKEPKPDRRDVNVTITPAQEPLLDEIVNRADRIKNRQVEPDEDNWLKLSGDARKISLDPRLYDPSLSDDAGSKANEVVKKAKAVYDATKEQKGTQVIFSDFYQHTTPDGKTDFNLFHDLRDKFIAAGVPKDELAIIHDYDSKQKKQALFNQVNSGKVRILMGSTDKMGIGTNIQERLKALHHLDQPWRPDQVTQREGRIIRSGNTWDDIDIYRYIAEPQSGQVERYNPKTGNVEMMDRPRAYDLQMYQQLARKQTFIEQFKAGDINTRTMEDAAGDVKLNAQTFAIAKAQASGNPDAMRKIKVEHEMRQYTTLDRAFRTQRSRDRHKFDYNQLQLSVGEQVQNEMQADLDKWKASDDGKNVTGKIDGKEFTDKEELQKYLEANPDPRIGKGFELFGIDIPVRTNQRSTSKGTFQTIEYKFGGEWHEFPVADGRVSAKTLLASVAVRGRGLEKKLIANNGFVTSLRHNQELLKQELTKPSPYHEKMLTLEKELYDIDTRLGIKKVEDEGGDSTAPDPAERDLDDDNSPERDLEGGFVRLDAIPAALPFTLAYEGIKGVKRVYAGAVDSLLEKVGLGKPRPEIRQWDPELADSMVKVDAGFQLHKAMADHIVKEVVGDLSRAQERGFVLMADQSTREWLQENKPEEYREFISDPKIMAALQAYRPWEAKLREGVRELGGNVIEDDYLKRAYSDYTAGIDSEKAKKGRALPSNFDSLISPQIDRMKGRQKEADFYYEKGLHEFGPSFAPRWMSIMGKLDENRAAWEFMSKATDVKKMDELPDSIYYNGKQFFSPEMAKMIREAEPGTDSARALADELGVDELPKPKDVNVYGIYEPLKGKRLENSARSLAEAVIKQSSAEEGTEVPVPIGKAMTVIRSLRSAYLGPKEIVQVLEHSRPDMLPAAIQTLARKVNPATQALRQQIVGLGFMVHFANDMRRIAQTAPGGVANPVGWVRAVKVAFDGELKARAKSGVGDDAYRSLLENAGISPEGIQEYKHFVEFNTDPKKWFGIDNAIRKGGKKGGEVTIGSALASPFKVTAEAVRPAAKFGHDILFGPGGMDQRARLWLHDFVKERAPEMSEADIANLVNERFGRYNRASWTQMQREIAPFMLFPGWDFSSMAYVLKHPIRTGVPPAVVIWAANRLLHMAGLNQRDDQNDPLALHVGKYNVTTGFLREPLAARALGAPLRFGRAVASHKSAGEALGEAAKGIPGDVAGATVGMAHPFLQAPLELAANRDRIGSGKEIIEKGDTRKRGKVARFRGGKAVEDVASFAGRKAFPLADRAASTGASLDRPANLATAIPSYAGVNVYKKGK